MPILAAITIETWGVILEAVLAGLAASVACGLGVLPLFIPGLDPARHKGLGYAVAGGLMFSASVYNLILPGLTMGDGHWTLVDVGPIVLGILVGSLFLAVVEARLHHQEEAAEADGAKLASSWGGRTAILVFFAMTCHSIPEGVAVGVGYTYDTVGEAIVGLGPTLALAIAIHNIPEGLAVAIPMRSAGASLVRCFFAAFLTSLPQPIAAVPAVILASLFEPLMPFLMGFAAGAMVFLIIMELIPEALHTEKPSRIAWGFVLGFCGMLVIQVIL